jgi:hypothetical protein
MTLFSTVNRSARMTAPAPCSALRLLAAATAAPDLRGQRSCRLFVGAREPQGLDARGELAGDDRSEPASADDRGGHDRNLLGATVLATAERPVVCRIV